MNRHKPNLVLQGTRKLLRATENNVSWGFWDDNP